jgi:AcrR family transcriptional regulator
MGGYRSISERLSRDPGHRLAPSDYVAAGQRARLLNAVTDLVAERGYQGTTIELISKGAGVALGTFYEQFASKEECFLAAFDADVEAAAEAFDQLLDREQPWPDLVAEGLEVFLDLVIAEPARAKFCLVASQSAGSAAFARYQETLERVAPVLREGRAFNPASAQLPDGLEVAIAGGIAWLVHQRLVGDDEEDLRALVPEMVQLTLTPYVGEEQARRTAHGIGSRERGPASRVPADRVGEM